MDKVEDVWKETKRLISEGKIVKEIQTDKKGKRKKEKHIFQELILMELLM